MRQIYLKNISLSDTETVIKILAGEKAFFEILIRRHNSSLYRIAHSYGFNHEESQDLMQETHVTAYLNLSKFENRSKYNTWLIRIMINKCLYQLQKARNKYEIINNDIIFTENNTKNMKGINETEKQILSKELGHVLEKSIEQLPSIYRNVFMLRELEELSISETAEVLNISENNVKIRLNRAKTMLRKELEKMYSKASIYEFNLIYCNKIVENIFEKIKTLDIRQKI